MTFYETREPNEPIVVAAEEVELIAAGVHALAQGEVRVRWLPYPRVTVQATFDEALRLNETPGDRADLRIRFPARDASTPVVLVESNFSLGLQGSTTRITAIPQDLAVPEVAAPASQLLFHVANLPDILGPAVSQGTAITTHPRAIALDAEGWRIEIFAAPDIEENIKKLKITGGYVLTHRGRASRTDNSTFTRRQGADLLDAIGDYLSFAAGLRTSPLLGAAYSAEGERIWEELQLRPVDQWQTQHSWFEPQDGAALVRVFPGFMGLYARATWRRPLSSAIYWYVNSNVGAGGIDSSIILSQAALELLAWVYLVEDRRSLSKDGFSRLSGADKIRLLLASLEIPVAIPHDLRELSELAARLNWEDGPRALTALRNSIVHPDLTRRLQYAQAIPDAWELGQWFVELIVLRLSGYSGTSAYRLRPRFAGEVRRVPWVR